MMFRVHKLFCDSSAFCINVLFKGLSEELCDMGYIDAGEMFEAWAELVDVGQRPWVLCGNYRDLWKMAFSGEQQKMTEEKMNELFLAAERLMK